MDERKRRLAASLYGKARRLELKTNHAGDFDVVGISAVDEPNNWVYYIASPDNTAQRYLYRTRLDGSGAAERVTPAGQTGTNSYNISPNGKWAFHTRSAFTTAPQTELVNLQSKRNVRVMVDNAELQAKINNLKKGASEFFRVDSRNGLQLDGWMMKPPDFDASKKYPVLFYVYGEPGSQTVTDSWDGSRYLWHLMLTQQGYIVASVENRGTPAPRGRAWRKSVYRRIGEIVSQDQANAAKAMLAKWSYLDASHVGVGAGQAAVLRL